MSKSSNPKNDDRDVEYPHHNDWGYPGRHLNVSDLNPKVGQRLKFWGSDVSKVYSSVVTGKLDCGGVTVDTMDGLLPSDRLKPTTCVELVRHEASVWCPLSAMLAEHIVRDIEIFHDGNFYMGHVMHKGKGGFKFQCRHPDTQLHVGESTLFRPLERHEITAMMIGQHMLEGVTQIAVDDDAVAVVIHVSRMPESDVSSLIDTAIKNAWGKEMLVIFLGPGESIEQIDMAAMAARTWVKLPESTESD